MSRPGKATYRPREAAQTPGTRETAEAPGTPVMLGNGGNTSNAGVGGNIGIGVVIPGGQRPGGNQTAGEAEFSESAV